MLYRFVLCAMVLMLSLSKPVAQDYSPEAREAARKNRAESEEKLKKIVIGMHNYHINHGDKMPAHAIYDASGKKPLLSWRVALLPYLDQETLYKKFRLNEAWDSVHNKKLIKEMPAIYAMTGVKSGVGMTHYQVFTMPVQVPAGKKKEFMPVFSLSPARVSLGQITVTDGTSGTICMTEATVPVEWTKPQDLVLEHDNAPLPKLGIRPNTDEFLIVMVAGDVKRVRNKGIEKNENDSRTLKEMIGWRDGHNYDASGIIK